MLPLLKKFLKAPELYLCVLIVALVAFFCIDKIGLTDVNLAEGEGVEFAKLLDVGDLVQVNGNCRDTLALKTAQDFLDQRGLAISPRGVHDDIARSPGKPTVQLVKSLRAIIKLVARNFPAEFERI